MFATSFDLDLFFDTFGSDEDRVAYWNSLAEPWWTPEHPAYTKVMACPAKTVPLRTHDDDVGCRKRPGSAVIAGALHLRNGRNRVAPAVLVVILSCECIRDTTGVCTFVKLKYRTYGASGSGHTYLSILSYHQRCFPATSGAVFPTTSGVFQKCIGVGKNMCKSLYSLDIV